MTKVTISARRLPTLLLASLFLGGCSILFAPGPGDNSDSTGEGGLGGTLGASGSHEIGGRGGAGTCGENDHVVSGVCVPCPPGTTNTKGDSLAGPDTSCAGTLCDEDEFVRDHLCVPCDETFRNAAGDDASGSNTACEDACFAAFGTHCDQPDAILEPPESGDLHFGEFIALSGDTLAISTGSGNVAGIGSVLVYVRNADTWSLEATLKPSNAENSIYGFVAPRIALSGDTLAIGVPGDDSAATGIDGDENDSSAENSGAVYIFARSRGSWSQQAYLKASNAEKGDYFGQDITLVGNTLAVGAPGEDSAALGVNGDQNDNSVWSVGAVYVFVRVGELWSQQAYIKPTSSGRSSFSSAIALSDDTLAVGSPETDVLDDPGLGYGFDIYFRAGLVDLYVREGSNWVPRQELRVLDDYIHLGSSIAIDESTLLVGAPSELFGDGPEKSQVSARVLEYRRESALWSQQEGLTGHASTRGDYFGTKLALNDKALLVCGDEKTSFFSREEVGWSKAAYFGPAYESIALSNDTVVLGPEVGSSERVVRIYRIAH